MTQAAAACTARTFQGCPAGHAARPTLLKAVSTRGMALPSRSRSSASFLKSSCRVQGVVQCWGKHQRQRLDPGVCSSAAKCVSALKLRNPLSNTASMLHEPCDKSRSLSARKHGMVRVLLVMLQVLVGMPPASCSLRRPRSRSAMAHCMATDNLISALPDCLHRPSQK